jgi:hypothetical protein
VSTLSQSFEDQRHSPHRAQLWFGLLGGAIAWLVHLMVAYGIAEFGCVGGLAEYTWMGISLVAWLILALSVLTGLIAAIATFVAYRARKRLESASSDGRDLVALAGVLTSGMFTFIIVVESLPIFYYLRHC